MGKRRNKSRLTKTDVCAICEMQRKITFVEDALEASRKLYRDGSLEFTGKQSV